MEKLDSNSSIYKDLESAIKNLEQAEAVFDEYFAIHGESFIYISQKKSFKLKFEEDILRTFYGVRNKERRKYFLETVSAGICELDVIKSKAKDNLLLKILNTKEALNL